MSEQTIYKNVALMQVGPAEGHEAMGMTPKGTPKKVPVFVDQTTLEQVRDCMMANANGTTKVKNTHEGSASMILAKVSNPHIDGDTLRGDLEFNPEHPDFKAFDWSMQNVASEFGLSVGFDPQYEIEGDRALARCNEVYHFALEDEPAATKGMFSAPAKKIPRKKVDMKSKNMSSDADFSKMITDAVTSACAAQMEPYAKRLDDMEACMKSMTGKKDTKGSDAGDGKSDEGGDAAGVHIHLKKILDGALEEFSKKQDAKVSEQFKSLGEDFAKKNLGMNFKDAPGKDEQKSGETPEKFEDKVRAGVKSGQFKKKSDAVAHFKKNDKVAFLDYIQRSEQATQKDGVPIAI